MLNPFPELLILSLLAPTIIRVVLGLLFIQSGWKRSRPEERAAAANETNNLPFNILGAYIIWYIAAVEVIIGFALVIGFFTQIAALVGLIWTIKTFFIRRSAPQIAKHSNVYYILVGAICLSLMFSGAGALAVDLPL